MAVKIIDNCCSSDYLNYLKSSTISSESWNLKYPKGTDSNGNPISIDDKFLKLDIIDENGIRLPFLAGLAYGLLSQIYAAGVQGLFIFPKIYWCGISG